MLDYYVNWLIPKKNPHAYSGVNVYKHVDNVDNFTFLTGFRRFYTHLRHP